MFAYSGTLCSSLLNLNWKFKQGRYGVCFYVFFFIYWAPLYTVTPCNEMLWVTSHWRAPALLWLDTYWQRGPLPLAQCLRHGGTSPVKQTINIWTLRSANNEPTIVTKRLWKCRYSTRMKLATGASLIWQVRAVCWQSRQQTALLVARQSALVAPRQNLAACSAHDMTITRHT